ncbi:hypothetical protein [Hyphomonas sp.]|uniref:hypothetical protein n=1 Tax=Hyphomonas sp. TaxID=87 RepID=UPI00391C70FD
MRRAGISALLALLAACGTPGPGDHQVLVESCVAAGESEAACLCQANALQQNLEPDLFAKTADRVGRQGVKVEAFIAELASAEEMLAFSAAVEDMMACPLTGAGG